MNPRDYHILARELTEGNRPVDFRTAINRAYYATYNVGVENLEEMGFKIDEGPQGHKQVQRRLNQSGTEELVHVSSKLGDLYSSRIDADYRLQKQSVERKKNAVAWVELSGQLIESIDNFCTGNNRGQIIASISNYLDRFPEGSV